MIFKQYILKDRVPVVANNLTEYALWNSIDANRRVGDDTVSIKRKSDGKREDVRVSTMFLGMDHGGYMDDVPILFETMVFGGPNDQYMDRCSTWEEAEDMHKRVLAMVSA